MQGLCVIFIDKQTLFTRPQHSGDKCSARTMDEDDARLAIHTQEPKIILHGSGTSSLYVLLLLYVLLVILLLLHTVTIYVRESKINTNTLLAQISLGKLAHHHLVCDKCHY